MRTNYNLKTKIFNREKKSVYFQNICIHIQLRETVKGYSIELPSASRTASEVIECLNLVIFIHAGHHTHDTGLQSILGIVGSLIGLHFDSEKLSGQIKRAIRPHV